MGFTTLFYHLKRASPAEAFLFLRLDQIQPSQQPGGAADLIAFGAYTGCRIEELAQLIEVHFIDGAFKVEDSKSAAGIREVPLHPALIGMVNRLTEKAGAGYLLEGSDEGSFGKRSDAMGKRFGKLKTALGFGPSMSFTPSARPSLVNWNKQGQREHRRRHCRPR